MPITLGNANRFVLGTVQFGLPYGIANRTGTVRREEAAAIVDRARAAGLTALDTAIAYGDSELALGEIGVGDWQVVSKVPALPQLCANVDSWLADHVSGSLERLQVPKLHGLLLHRAGDLAGAHGAALYAAMTAAKARGVVDKIGVSIYDPTELEAIAPRYTLDVVQAPFNVFDRRIVTSGWLGRLSRSGTEVHVRSVFLQGLLLMAPSSRPPAFGRWHALWTRWQRWLDEHALSSLQGCLRFVAAEPAITRVIVGVTSVVELEEILTAAPAAVGTLGMPPDMLASADPDLINPSRWNALLCASPSFKPE